MRTFDNKHLKHFIFNHIRLTLNLSVLKIEFLADSGFMAYQMESDGSMRFSKLMINYIHS